MKQALFNVVLVIIAFVIGVDGVIEWEHGYRNAALAEWSMCVLIAVYLAVCGGKER